MAEDLPHTHADDVLRRADELDGRISEKTEAVIADLVAYRDKSRRADRWRNFTLVLLFVMFFIGIFIVIKIRDNATSIKQLCVSTNEANANQTKLWHFILSIPPQPDETDQQKDILIQFSQLVDQTFAQHNCSEPKAIP